MAGSILQSHRTVVLYIFIHGRPLGSYDTSLRQKHAHIYEKSQFMSVTTLCHARPSGPATGLPTSVLARIDKFTSYQIFFTVIKTKDQLFVRGIWGDEMREKARKSAV